MEILDCVLNNFDPNLKLDYFSWCSYFNEEDSLSVNSHNFNNFLVCTHFFLIHHDFNYIKCDYLEDRVNYNVNTKYLSMVFLDYLDW